MRIIISESVRESMKESLPKASRTSPGADALAQLFGLLISSSSSDIESVCVPSAVHDRDLFDLNGKIFPLMI